MHRVVFLCLLSILGAAPAAADENAAPASKQLTIPQVAEKVLAAVKANDPIALKALAEIANPGPWVVADELCLRGEYEAATTFARAAPQQDNRRLPALIAARRKRAPHAGVREALKSAFAAHNPKDAELAVSKMEAQRGNGDRFERAWLDSVRGDYLAQLGRIRDAVDALMNAGDLALEVGWLAQAAANYEQAGLLAPRLRLFSVMLRAGEQVRHVHAARGSVTGEAWAAQLLGWAAAEMGDYDRSLRHMLEAVDILEEQPASQVIAEAQFNLSMIYERRGEYSKAQAAAQKAMNVARRIDQPYLIARALTAIGAVRISLQDTDGALLVHQEALALFRKEKGRARDIAECQANIGTLLIEKGDYADGKQHLDDALKVFDRLRDGASVCQVILELGKLLMKLNRLPEAMPRIEDALSRARLRKDRRLEALALNELARLKLRLGRLDEARRHADDVVRIATEMTAPPLLVDARGTLAEVALAQKQYARAVSESREALRFSSRMLTGLDQTTGSAGRETLAQVFATATKAAAAWGRSAELFEFLENGRAGALLEALDAREEIRDAAIPARLRMAEQVAKTRVRIARVRYQDALAQGKLKPIRRARADLDAAWGGLQAVVDQIQREAKTAASVLYPEAVSLDDFQAEMQAGEVLVLYGVLPEEVIAQVVTAAEARIVSLGKRASIEAATQVALDDPSSKPEKAIQHLAARLVTPLGLPKETKRLLVSPSGALAYVPFALLTDVPEVACVPSGTAYRTFGEQAGLTGSKVLALGDPQYRRGDGRRPVRHPGLKLTPLPQSRIEAKAVGDVLLLGESATEAALSQTLATQKRWRAVHLACHGIVDAERPMRSALAVTPQGEDDGLLSYSDVFRLRVPADLAVLSACETGRGKIYRAEGIVGMTQAFMLAGAPRVICSLWNVDDEATRALMIKFYELWNPKKGAGLGAAAALRKAQEYVRDHAKHPEWKHPFYWAAWVLWGLPD